MLLPDSASSDRWEKDDRRFFEEAFKAAGVEYNIVNAEGDARTQLNQAEQAINADAKVILLVNLERGSGAAIIDNAREADVKVVDYDRLTIAGSGADVYVSFDNVKVGQTMADTVGPVIDKLPRGQAEDRDDERRSDGQQLEALQAGLQRTGAFAVKKKVDAGEWQVVADQDVPDWDNQQALTLFEQILVGAEEQRRRGVRRQRRHRRIGHLGSAVRRGRSDPGVRPGRDGARDPERPCRAADDDRLQADQGGGGGRSRRRDRALERRGCEGALQATSRSSRSTTARPICPTSP